MIIGSYATGQSTCEGDNCYSGGLVGSNLEGTINNSYAIGNSMCSDRLCFSGGLIGENSKQNAVITNVYATGQSTCEGEDCRSGGLVGVNSIGMIINSYATGSSTCSEERCLSGGLVGRSSGTIRNSYRVQSSGTDPGDQRTVAQLRCPTVANASCAGVNMTYIGWSNITWNFGDNATLPTIRDIPACPTFRPNCRY